MSSATRASRMWMSFAGILNNPRLSVNCVPNRVRAAPCANHLIGKSPAAGAMPKLRDVTDHVFILVAGAGFEPAHRRL